MSPPPLLIGYFAKRRTLRPDWLEAPAVREICSVSGCIADAPSGWIDHWAHNELWVYDTPDSALAVVPTDQAVEFELFAYRLTPWLYRSGTAELFELPAISPEPMDETFESLGFDAVSRTAGTSFECSPLSCCNLARQFSANEWCLFSTHDQATAAAMAWSVRGAEPGPYVVIEVLRRHTA